MMIWISRFSFTFIILGAFLLIRVYQWQTGKIPLESWQVTAFVVGGALFLALGVQGIKYRHRRV
jgi:hypothetical protein